jgi:hypothetical protein
MDMRTIKKIAVIRQMEYFLSFKSAPKLKNEIEKYLELIKK